MKESLCGRHFCRLAEWCCRHFAEVKYYTVDLSIAFKIVHLPYLPIYAAMASTITNYFGQSSSGSSKPPDSDIIILAPLSINPKRESKGLN